MYCILLNYQIWESFKNNIASCLPNGEGILLRAVGVLYHADLNNKKRDSYAVKQNYNLSASSRYPTCSQRLHKGITVRNAIRNNKVKPSIGEFVHMNIH